LHNDELHSLYSSPNIVRRMRWAGYVARMGEGRCVYRILVGRPEGKRPLGKPRRRWKDNIKMDLREIGIDGANWIQLVQDRVQWRAFLNTVMNLRVP
jgi:transcription termination factor 2